MDSKASRFDSLGGIWVKTENLEVDEKYGKEWAGKYCFKEISWAKRNRIIQKYTVYSKVTGQMMSSDFIAIQAATVMASLHGQPDTHPLTLERLLDEEEGVPIELGETFSKVANKLNSVGQEDLRFLLEQLDEASRTQLFKTFGYAKSLDGQSPTLENSQQEQCRSSP
jgi:hypothetical protein